MRICEYLDRKTYYYEYKSKPRGNKSQVSKGHVIKVMLAKVMLAKDLLAKVSPVKAIAGKFQRNFVPTNGLMKETFIQNSSFSFKLFLLADVSFHPQLFHLQQ